MSPYGVTAALLGANPELQTFPQLDICSVCTLRCVESFHTANCQKQSCPNPEIRDRALLEQRDISISEEVRQFCLIKKADKSLLGGRKTAKD